MVVERFIPVDFLITPTLMLLCLTTKPLMAPYCYLFWITICLNSSLSRCFRGVWVSKNINLFDKFNHNDTFVLVYVKC